MFDFLPDISSLATPLLLGGSAFFILLAVLAPSPHWVKSAPKRAGYADPDSKRIISRSTWMILLTLGAAAALFFTGMSVVMAVIGGFMLAALISPLINSHMKKKREKESRMEALRISEYVAGRMNSQATLLIALESLLSEHKQDGRSIPIAAPGLESSIRAVNLGEPLTDQLIALSELYQDLPELSGMWRKYAIMSDSSLGAEAMAIQADDLAENLRIMDELRDNLETELTLSTMTRYFMFFLIGGFTLYLILSGGSMGDVLVHTTAGNIIIGIAMLLLFLSQVVGNHIEKMPTIWF